jgi:hypothetical protein
VIAAALALALAAEPAAAPAAFRLKAREVEEAFDRMEAALMADPDISYHPRSGIRYGAAKCRTTEEPGVALCKFRITTSDGTSRKVTNHFRRFDAGRWIADLEL